MKRALAIAGTVVAAAVLVASPAVRAGDSGVPDVFEARAVAAGLHPSLAVPAYVEAFAPYSSSEATNGSSHGYHSPFYGGFLLTAAAEQYGFPRPPGTTETLYPQGPAESSAAFAPLPGGAALFASSGTSTASGSSGRAISGGGAAGPLATLRYGEARSDAGAREGASQSVAAVVLQDVALGGVVRIGSVRGEASARATGDPGGATVKGRVVLQDVTVGGVPIVVTGDRASIGPAAGGSPGGQTADEVLARAGVTIDRRPDRQEVAPDGSLAALHVGGFAVSFRQPGYEFALEYVLGEVAVRARAGSVDFDGGPGETPVPTSPAASTAARGVDPPRARPVPSPPAEPAPPLAPLPAQPASVIRRVTRTAPADHADWAALAGAAALAAPFSLLLRRAFRLAAAP